MKKLFLVSSFKHAANMMTEFGLDLKGKTVTFIPTASNVEKVVFYVNAGKKALQELGLIIDELNISTASYDEIKRKLRSNDIIYVTGGNTFFLLQELQRTGADTLIIDEVNAGKLYIGESAGAMVLSENIEYVKKMDNETAAPDLTSSDALGLVDFFPVPHYNSFPFKKITQSILDTYASTHNLIPICNTEALVINNKERKRKSL